jgi:signal transduction histidine kinase
MTSVTGRVRDAGERRVYIGVDRRARVGPRPNPRDFVLAGSFLVVASLPFALIAGRGPLPHDFDARTLNVALLAMTALLALVVGSVVVMQWRLTGETRSLRIGVAVLVLALAFAVNAFALIVSDLDRNSFPVVLAPAARVVAIAILLVAFFAPDIDTRLRPRRVVTMAALWTVGLAAGFGVFTISSETLGAGHTVEPGAGGPTPVRLVAIALFAVAATLYAHRGLTKQRWLLTWIALMLFGLALSEALLFLVESPGDLRLTGGAILALAGLAFALNGSARELAGAYRAQQTKLFDHEVQSATVASLQRAERSLREEHEHDAKSALLAVQAALRSLERESQLAGALDAELTRVRNLIDAHRSREATSHAARLFTVGEALAPTILLRVAADAPIRSSIAEDVCVYGQPAVVVEIVDNLIANALRHAPGSPIWVTGHVERDVTVVRVEDAGPGIPEADREQVFERGHTGPTGGAGIGLSVARRLADSQRGQLVVREGLYGGAAFLLTLPARIPADVVDETSSILMKPPDDAEIIILDDDAGAADELADGLWSDAAELSGTGERRTGGQRSP